MNIFEKLNFGKKALQAIVLKKKTPLSAQFQISYKCNLKCQYCGSWQKETNGEMDTKSIFNVIEELSSLGTKFIKISGGEPLLRKDLGDIIDFCKSKKMFVYINSNGTLVKKYFSKLRNVKEIQLSLDGPRDINDSLRGKGVYDKVIEAIEICKANEIKVLLNTVISSYNISHIPRVLDFAERYKVGVYFQPADHNLSTQCPKDISRIFRPDTNSYKNIISYLMKKKSQGNKFISNSIIGLKYLYHWPQAMKMDCLIGLISFVIEPDGNIFVCNSFPDYQKYTVPINGDLKQAFNDLCLPHQCDRCPCASVAEFNLLGKFWPDTMLGLWKRL